MVFLLLAAAGCFFLVLWLTGTKLLAYAAFLLTMLNAALWSGTKTFLTEIPAATLMVSVSVFSLLVLTRRRPVYSALLGLALAALVLTKVVFAYLWIFVALALVASYVLKGGFDRSDVMLVSVFLVVFLIPVGAWMVRNYVLSGNFSLVEQRADKVWSIRSAYNEMRDDEFAAGFWYYLPMVCKKDMVKRGIPKESFERFNSAGFRQTGQNNYRRRYKEILKEYRGLELPSLVRKRKATARIANEAKARLLANPWRHLKVSLLLAWRGMFPDMYNFGCSRASRTNVRNARLATNSIVNIIGGFALIIAPLWFWFFHRRFEAVIIVLPALYSHGVYAVASHFNPRYAWPEIPLRAAAAMLLVFLLVSSMCRLGRRVIVSVAGQRSGGSR